MVATLKKHSKKIARRAKVAAKRQWITKVRDRQQYPRFVFEPNEAPVEFVEAIRREAEAIDFRDSSVFRPWETQVYRRIKEVGADTAMSEITSNYNAAVHFMLHVGTMLYQNLGSLFLRRFVPFHHVQFLPEGRCIKMNFRSLKKHKGSGGTVYYSRFHPKVQVNGQLLTVAFTTHAVQQTIDRLSYRWPSYEDSAYINWLFDRCLDFETCVLYPNQPAFTFFCPGVLRGLSEHVLGDKFSSEEDYSQRAGYCPAVIEGGYFVAKTLLYPGYASTPEFGCVMKARMSREEKRTMIERTENLKTKHVIENTDGMNLIKWFHDQGIPQIKPGKARYAHLSR